MQQHHYECKPFWLHKKFYKHEHMLSSIEYSKLKLSNFVVKILNREAIITPFNTAATCSYISHHLFQKISDKVDMTRMSLQINTASRTTLGPIGIVPLILNINDYIFIHNLIIHKKLRQQFIIGLNFAQRYKIGVDWDAYGTLFLRYKGKKIATVMRKSNPCWQSVALLETLVSDTWAKDERKCFVTNNTFAISPYHVSIILLQPVDHMVLWPNTVIEIDKNSFPLIEQPSIAILPLLQKVGDR